MELTISNSSYVSLDSNNPCNITLILKPFTFRDIKTKAYFENDLNLQIYQLPRLIDRDGVELVKTIENMAETQTSILTLNLVLDIILGSSLKLMWGMVNTLQIIVYFNSVKVNLSVNATVFLDKLRIIALGEFIPYNWLYEYFLDQWNLKIESIDKLGSMTILIGALFLITILVLLLKRII